MRIGFIGGGNMASAMIGGLLKQGYIAADIAVVEPSEERRAQLASEFSVFLEESAAAVLASDLLILAVKPQVLRAVLTSLPRLAETTCILSIAAGVRAVDISRWLQGHAAVVRAMPNTPALVGAGITGLFALPGSSVEQKNRAEQALKAVGQVLWVADETMIDAVTAISGSGPAYVFLFIEALESAALNLGFDAVAARSLALHTVYGSATLALHDGSDPAELRARVTSKGGTTERGVAALEEHGIRQAVLAAAQAAAARAKELGDLLGAE
jgi:pyrroline-5-carboxylate reductase